MISVTFSGMKIRVHDVKNRITRKLVRKLRIQWQQIDVMLHCVVELVFGVQIPDVDQRSSIEPQQIFLVDHENMMWNLLCVQELWHVWHKFEKISETVADWHNHCEFLFVENFGTFHRHQISDIETICLFIYNCRRLLWNPKYWNNQEKHNKNQQKQQKPFKNFVHLRKFQSNWSQNFWVWENFKFVCTTVRQIEAILETLFEFNF